MTTGSPVAPRFLRFLAWLVPAVLLFALFAIVVALVMSGISGLTGVLMGALAGGCLVLGLLLAYWNLVDWTNLRIIRQWTSGGHAEWDDGAVVAVEGVVRVDGEPLISPFSATRCAAYTYAVSRHRHSSVSDRNVRMLIARGFHLLRTRVEGAGRSLRLFALPGFEDELRRTEDGETWANEAHRLVNSLDDKAQRGGEHEVVSRLLEARQVGTDEVRCDYLVGTLGEAAKRVTVEEEVLPVDQTVCVIGTYDRQRNGLTPRRSKMGPNLMVYSGSASDVLARVGKDLRMFTRVAAVLVSIAVAIVAYAVV